MKDYYKIYTFSYRSPALARDGETTPFTDYYTYTGKAWDESTHQDSTISGTEPFSGYPSGYSSPPTYVKRPTPPNIASPLEDVIDSFEATRYQPGTGFSTHLVRVHHAGGGNVVYEDHNPVKAIVDPLVDITKISSPNSLTPHPGQVTIHVLPVDGTTPLDSHITVEGYLNSDKSSAPTWVVFPRSSDALQATKRFEVLTAGTYPYAVRLRYGNWVSEAYPQLTGSVTVEQARDEVATVAIRPPVATATALGRATGTITVQVEVTGSATAEAVVTLAQDGQPLLDQNGQPLASTPATANAGNDYTVRFDKLPAGYYEISAHLLNNSSTAGPVPVQIPFPDLEIGDQLTFLPWVQSKLARAATVDGGRSTLALGAVLTTDPGTITSRTETLFTPVKAQISGAGDVVGINQRAILGTTPVPDAGGFSPLQLAAIEFKEEDLPWRYSLPTAGATPPLPWLFLLVLKEDEFEALPLTGQPLSRIRVHANGPYPSTDPAQQQLWAHVQVNASMGDPGQPNATPPVPPPPVIEADIRAFLDQTLPTNPDLAYSRLFCPRRLEANTAYHAFLLPALEAGRLAGLGLTPGPGEVGSSIQNLTQSRDFPVYFKWQFATGVEDDFEALAGQLARANEATRAAATPTLAVALPAATYALPLPSLLVDAEAPVDADPAGTATQELAVSQYLYGQLAPGFTLRRPAAGRPVVTPPLYGRAYMVTQALIEPRTEVANSWKHTLNLDPRYRALAALGARVVQDNQEEYVRRAWEQVRDILLANEKLRGLQYGLRTTAGLRDQHLPLDTATPPAGGVNRFASSAVQAFTSAIDETAGDLGGARLAVSAPPLAGPPLAGPSLADYGLQLTGMALGRVRVSRATAAAAPSLAGLTAREAIRRSSTPLAAFSPAFRRLLKPFGKYQVSQAGRPLRPTQSAPDFDANSDLRQPGTSLRQRDGLLSRLITGELVAAAERAQLVRTYQFRDQVVDDALAAETKRRPDGSLPSYRPLPLRQNGILISDENSRARIRLAYTAFKDLGGNKLLGFIGPQYVRPVLPLMELKADVAAGTEPGPVILAKLKQVSPLMPAPVGRGDYEGADYNATDFYVGDYDEPAPALPARGDWAATDFSAADFLVDKYGVGTGDPAAGARELSSAPADVQSPMLFAAQSLTTALTSEVTTTTTGAAPTTDVPLIRQAKVIPVFRDAMGEQLCQRHPELFVPGLSDFPTGGVAVLGVNQAFIEAYMLGLNHALGSELLWRGFPVDMRGTFFQQFWDVSEHVNTLPDPATPATDAEQADREAQLVDITPIDTWVSNPLGSNTLSNDTLGQEPLRLALRSELLRRYPTLVLGLQPGTADGPDEDFARLVYPRQRLPVGQDLAIVTFNVTLNEALDEHYYLVLMERPGQPQFGLDKHVPQGTDLTAVMADPLSWNELSWQYLERYLPAQPGDSLVIPAAGRPRATAEPVAVAHITDSAVLAYALFQEPVLAAIPVSRLLS